VQHFELQVHQILEIFKTNTKPKVSDIFNIQASDSADGITAQLSQAVLNTIDSNVLGLSISYLSKQLSPSSGNDPHLKINTPYELESETD